MFSIIKSIFKGIGSFFKRFIKTTVYDAIEEIADIAEYAVETVNKTCKDKSNEYKFQEAKKLIKELIKTREKDYKDNVINTAIEIAVALIKEGK
jgi:5-bromo-4-chloroindolyl phosphate hydrolysis protein